jgi:NitT/TauT family transport system substrate-binding protein
MRTKALAFVIIGAFLLASCGSSNAKLEKVASQPFRVAFNTWVGYSPLLLAQEKGFLREQGIDVVISMLEGVPEKNSALIKGTIDAVGHTADAAVVSAASGVDGQIIFVFDQSWGSDGVVTKKSVRSMKDLKGKRVALEPGFTGHFFFLSLLRDEGMKLSDVQIVPMETGTAGSTFVAGAVEAAATCQPWLGKVKALPDSKVLFSSADKPGRIIDILYMNRQVVKTRRADVVKLVRAMGKATDWYANNKAEGDQIMARFWKLSPQEQADSRLMHALLS